MFCWPTSFKVIFILGSFCPGAAVTCSPCFHGSRYISGGPLGGTGLCCRGTRANCWGIQFPLGDQAGFAGCHLRPPGQLYPHQVGTFVELPSLGHHAVIVAATFNPDSTPCQPLQPYSGSNIKLLLHMRHILEGIILLYSSPLLLAWEKVIKNLVLDLVPPSLPKGGEIVLIIHPEYAFQVFLPSLAPKSGHPLQGIPWSPGTAATLLRGAPQG